MRRINAKERKRTSAHSGVEQAPGVSIQFERQQHTIPVPQPRLSCRSNPYCMESMMIDLREERMSDAMVKWHIGGLPRAAVLRQFTAADLGPCHDHPFGFHSFIISGGYVEEVFDRETDSSKLVSRTPGESFYVPATHIHRLVNLPDGECWTMILPGPHEQKSGFWEFREDGAYHRFWDQADFQLLSAGED